MQSAPLTVYFVLVSPSLSLSLSNTHTHTHTHTNTYIHALSLTLSLKHTRTLTHALSLIVKWSVYLVLFYYSHCHSLIVAQTSREGEKEITTQRLIKEIERAIGMYTMAISRALSFRHSDPIFKVKFFGVPLLAAFQE